MLDAKEVRRLYDYNAWANRRVLAAAAALGHEQFTRDLGSSHCSLRDTLVHAMAAEWIYLRRWHGESPRSMLDPAEFPDLAAVRARWEEIERQLSEFIDTVTDDSLTRVIAYTNTRGEVWRYTLADMLRHVVNHSTYHRGQVTTLLRQLGAPAPSTDLLFYVDEEE